MSDLDPISPVEARDWYVADRDEELAEATLKAHQYRLAPFLEWCELQEIESMTDLRGRHFSKYKLWRKNEKGSPNNVTLNTQLSTLRVFIKWCGKRNIVPRDLFEYIDPPRMAPMEDVRTVTLEAEAAHEILAHLRKFEYATNDHIVFELLWSVGMREGAVHALDLSDFVEEPPVGEDATGPYLKIRHRPDTDTPLKNRELGERDVSLKPELRDMLADYIGTNRKALTDAHGREPLLTTRHGRLSRQTIRRIVYGFTRSCVFQGNCPEGRDFFDCEAACANSKASKCPVSVSPHAIRKGAITWARLNDVPLEAISERMNVSVPILKKHYDRRTNQQKMESRRNYFDGL